jgi:energy-converting hydrogenase B subunit D
MNDAFNLILLLLLIGTALATVFSRDLLAAVVIFSSYSMIMSVLWLRLQAPDLALAEVAVGAGITTVLFVVTIFKARRSGGPGEEEGG